MTVFLIRRISQSMLVLLATSLIVFFGVYAIGNPLELLLPPDATPAEIAQASRSLGLDKPLPAQYLIFLGNALQGDFGRSFVFNEPTISLILTRFPATLELALMALFLSITIGIPLGLYAGLRGGIVDRVIMTGSIAGFSLPSFWQGMLLILIFSINLGWLPSTGRGEIGYILGIPTSLATWDGIQHLILPAANLALFKVALLIRLTRTGVRETLPLDFIRFARAKGLSEKRVFAVHILKYILIPIVTVIGMEFGSLLAFATVTETIFSWPGIGKLIIDSIMRLDRPVVVAYILVVVTLFIIINTLVDVLYSILDPRVRLGGAK